MYEHWHSLSLAAIGVIIRASLEANEYSGSNQRRLEPFDNHGTFEVIRPVSASMGSSWSCGRHCGNRNRTVIRASAHLQHLDCLTSAHYLIRLATLCEDPVKQRLPSGVVAASRTLSVLHCALGRRAPHACEQVCELGGLLAEEVLPAVKI
jgi:hypothetical protein